MSTPEDSLLIKWRDSPRHERGTYDIVTLCASTLVICAWSAVHVDVPKRRTWKSTTGARIFWFLVGVFMPELLLMFAVGQFRTARRVTSYAHTKLKFPKPPPSLWSRCITWFAWLALVCRRNKTEQDSSDNDTLMNHIEAQGIPSATTGDSVEHDAEAGPAPKSDNREYCTEATYYRVTRHTGRAPR